ncbi:MAG: amino acid permease [Candidatus Hydrogenedentes bacterium]|nr:amino acid permease [Candidatus Hydrogenedentota bacterium]
MSRAPHKTLKRELGVGGATLMGLGSILGTGVFVSFALAAGISGPAVILATVLAAMVATCNALSSAQLAAAHPVSGGTYEYGYKYLHPVLGFTAGWMFLCAKSASAATAALGFAGYALHLFGERAAGLHLPLALGAVIFLTLIAAAGIRQSNRTNIAIVSVTIVALLAFIIAVLPEAWRSGSANLKPFFHSEAGTPAGAFGAVLHASALMFVAYAGYGRIATLGEEVREPRRTIPRAIITTLIVSAVIYITVALVSVAAAGADTLRDATQQTAAPLEIIARQYGLPGLYWAVALGAVTAMLSVLLNLVLGLSRVVLAMARRADAPHLFTRLNASETAPLAAVFLVGAIIAGLVLIGNVKITWSFSAFTVLVYYAITNLAALRLPKADRLYPRPFAWGGLIGCLGLAFWVEVHIWMAGLGLLAAGLVWFAVARFAQKG